MSRLVFVFVLLTAIACNRRIDTFKEIRGYAQGTTYSVTYADERRRNLSSEIDSLLLRIDLSVSTYVENSTISRFNRSDRGVKTDSIFSTVLHRSMEIARESGGLFDPTVENLVSGWGFGSRNAETMTPDKIQEMLEVTGIDLLEIRKDSLLKLKPGVRLTFNAIAQGYSVDLICELLESKGITEYLVEIGGETRAKGKNPQGEWWRIGIEKPEASFDGRPFQAVAALNNTSLVTSGNYRKFRVDSLTGIKYSHTINPITGRPVAHSLLSASILHERAMDADAYATVMMVMGMDNGKQFLRSKGLEGFLIYSDSTGSIQTWVSEGFKKTLLPLSTN